MNFKKVFILTAGLAVIFGLLFASQAMNPQAQQPAPAVGADGVWSYACPSKGTTYTEADLAAQQRFQDQYSLQGITGFEGWTKEASAVCGDQPQQVAAGTQIDWAGILGDNFGLIMFGSLIFITFVILIIKTKKLDVAIVGAAVAWGLLLLISGGWFVLWSFQSGALLLGLVYVFVRSNFAFFGTHITVKDGMGHEAHATMRSFGPAGHVASAHESQVRAIMEGLPRAIAALPARQRRVLLQNPRFGNMDPAQQWAVVQRLLTAGQAPPPLTNDPWSVNGPRWITQPQHLLPAPEAPLPPDLVYDSELDGDPSVSFDRIGGFAQGSSPLPEEVEHIITRTMGGLAWRRMSIDQKDAYLRQLARTHPTWFMEE